MCIDDKDCDCHLEDDDDFDGDWESELIDGVGFEDSGGDSALRAETEDNPRDRPCPTCGEPDRLTRIDEMRHYQCDRCSERDELGF